MGKFPVKPDLGLTGWICLIAAVIPLVIGLIYPPVNYDSLTYHLPRIEHWLENNTVSYYPTSNPRQNVYAPFAEFVILQLRGLSGGDRFANSVQWLAYAGSIINVSLVTQLLGGERRAQILAALACASIPMAILQASTTQTDMFVSWQLTSMVAFGLLWARNHCSSAGICFGASLGLACLTKGTAYPISLPFVVAYAAYALQKPRMRLGVAICAALCALLCNLPTFTRNVALCGNPFANTLDIVKITRLFPSLSHIIGNVACNIAINIEWPNSLGGKVLHNKITGMTDAIVKKMGINEKSFFPFGVFSKRSGFSSHEDTAQNGLILILTLLAFFWIVFKGRRGIRLYGACVGAAFILFCSLIAWQPWITRLQLPIFVLSMPIVGVAFSGWRWVCYLVGSVCLVSLLYHNAYHSRHPILGNNASGFALSPYFFYPREAKYFFPHRDLDKEKFFHAADILCAYKNVGLIVGGNSRYYHLFPLLRDRGCHPKIFHIVSKTDLEKADSLFFMDDECRFGICRPKKERIFAMPLNH